MVDPKDPIDEPRTPPPRTISGHALSGPQASARPSKDTYDLNGRNGVKVRFGMPILVSLAGFAIAMGTFFANYVFATKTDLGAAKIEASDKVHKVELQVIEIKTQVQSVHSEVEAVRMQQRVIGENIEAIGRRVNAPVIATPTIESVRSVVAPDAGSKD